VQDRVYEPFGESLEVTTRAPQWPQGMAYTGHVLDNLTRITYAQARYYDQLMGRFMSVDPVAPDAGSFNRYWYANNNPYNNIDPDGRKACGKDTACRLEQGERGGSSVGFFGADGLVQDGETQVNAGLPSSTVGSGTSQADGWLAKWSGASSGAEAAQYWADLQVETGNPLYGVPGVFASLWTPDTALATASTLTPAGVLRPVGAWAGRYVFGKGAILNSNRYLRLGLGRDGGQSVVRLAGEWLGKVPGPVRDLVGIKEIKSGVYKWDLWTRGPL